MSPSSTADLNQAPGAPTGSMREEGARAPNGQTFRQIYDENINGVWHALRRHSVPDKDVMDAAQNVFLVVHKKLPEFEGRSLLRTWIHQIVRRVASDYRRSAPVRREVTTTTSELDERRELSGSAEDAAAHSQRVDLAQRVLAQLPDNQREVFIMYELEQMSGQEIARELDLPLGTIRSRLRMARDAFRREVQLLVGAKKLEAG